MNIFAELMQTDLFSLLSNLTTALNDGAAALGIPALVFQIAALVLAAVVGIFGYKLIKLLTAVAAGVVGYYLVGAELYFLVCSWFNLTLPDWAVYIPAAVFAILFFFLAFKKFSYTFYTVMGIIGVVLTYFYSQNILLAIGGGLFLALLAMYMIRFAFVLLTSLAAGFVGVSVLSAVLPDVAILKISLENWIGIAIAGGVALVFIIIQMIITRNDQKTIASSGKTKFAAGTVRRRKVIRDL